MTRYLIEVALETPEDALTAESGGADRVELSTALDLGGLTPSLGLFEEVQAATRLPVLIMIRPRPGDFVYSPAELRVMSRDIEKFRPLTPAGFVFGVLSEEGTVNRDACWRLRELCGEVPCIFHRAFDRCPNPRAALDDLINLGFVRVLTSGRQESALAGAAYIAELHKHAAGKIELLPCGRIRAANVETVIRLSGCAQIHASFAEAIPDSPNRGRRGYPPRYRVGIADLSETRKRLDEFA
jgi:copper homeostasis protein CutC